jgi:hypothetical protein
MIIMLTSENTVLGLVETSTLCLVFVMSMISLYIINIGYKRVANTSEWRALPTLRASLL